ncbi:hypothetical protein JOQ06_014280 [Pogonophryne albipinna]|uniref:Uncharacterized protein n=1 Tax=Pogonophryne albipinna TaxID=1090488 RepID=A0AAD6A8B7_9TELE|nr:hypothetical protein JOQ06_014280 [Pogonophryne albipinna]
MRTFSDGFLLYAGTGHQSSLFRLAAGSQTAKPALEAHLRGLNPCMLYPSVCTFPACFLAFLFIEGFQFLDRHYCLSAQPPRQREPPPPPPTTTTTTITAVLPKNKRESVRHHPLDLFHTRAPTSVPDGVAFFQGFSQPQESSKIEAPLPLDPTTQLPVIHLLRRHAPVARAPPLSIPPHQGVLLKSLTTLCWGLLPGHHYASSKNFNNIIS